MVVKIRAPVTPNRVPTLHLEHGIREILRTPLCAVAERSPLCDSGSQLLEHLFGIFPVDASVCNGNTVLQTLLALLGHLLVAYKAY